MKDKVIFDTNVVRNPEINNFLGGREILERFLPDADIVIPETVIQEIKRQKRSSLLSNKDKFLTNPFHKLIGVDEEHTKSFSIDDYIQRLIDEETIPFEIIDLKDNNVLPQIKELAIHKRAPFEAADNTDKGFKDALIYFSVLEYLQEITNKYVFVFAKDIRLKEALANHDNIIVINSYEEFKQHSISQFYGEYFINRVNEELGITISKENIKETWNNINDNKIVLIEFDGTEYVIETDSSEIISYSIRAEYILNIELLITSLYFNDTDALVDRLIPFMAYFTDDEIYNILNAACNNTQIRWIIEKPDIQELIGTLYENRKELIDDPVVANFLEKIFG